LSAIEADGENAPSGLTHSNQTRNSKQTAGKKSIPMTRRHSGVRAFAIMGGPFVVTVLTLVVLPRGV
jgi:hypothetical protein